MPVVIMGTPHGRASAPSAGENELDPPELPERIPGTAWCLNNTRTQSGIQISSLFVSCNINNVSSACRLIPITELLKIHVIRSVTN